MKKTMPDCIAYLKRYLRKNKPGKDRGAGAFHARLSLALDSRFSGQIIDLGTNCHTVDDAAWFLGLQIASLHRQGVQVRSRVDVKAIAKEYAYVWEDNDTIEDIEDASPDDYYSPLPGVFFCRIFGSKNEMIRKKRRKAYILFLESVE